MHTCVYFYHIVDTLLQKRRYCTYLFLSIVKICLLLLLKLHTLVYITMSDRYDNDTIRHFVSRARQPKVLAAVPRGHQPVPVQLTVVVNDRAVSTNEIDATRFRYTGTSTQASRYEHMSSRQTVYDAMRSVFE